ncbi:MAG: hypothetical protein JWM42_402 [Burkholderia sp.]|nr:hypothetical protein [Burkholderia sp.]
MVGFIDSHATIDECIYIFSRCKLKSASGSIRLGIDVLQSRALRILFGELQDAGGNVGCEHISVWTDDHDLLAVHHAAASTLREIPRLTGCCASS